MELPTHADVIIVYIFAKIIQYLKHKLAQGLSPGLGLGYFPA